MNTPSFFDADSIETLRKQTRLEPHNLKFWRNAICKNGLDTESALTFLPTEEQRNAFRNVIYHPLEICQVVNSAQDGSTGLLFKTHDGYFIEAVILRIQSGRTSLCLSSQVGCAVGCQFCSTGKMGFKRQLTTAEIVDQAAHAIALLRPEQRKLRNIVFMGMGEPLLNCTNLYPALDLLKSPQWFELSDRHITISTVGICDKIIEWGTRYPEMSFALSLHSARQNIRNSLIPIAKHYPLEELKQACKKITPPTAKRYIMVEYLMLHEISDTAADIEALAQWCDGLPIHLNIIRFNPGYQSSPFISTPDDHIQKFADEMRKHVAKVTFRCSLGSDIRAACGQLAGKKEITL